MAVQSMIIFSHDAIVSNDIMASNLWKMSVILMLNGCSINDAFFAMMQSMVFLLIGCSINDAFNFHLILY